MTHASDSAGLPADEHYSRMMSMITGHWVTQVVRTVATYSIAEHLSEGPATAEQIAEAKELDVDATRRLLRTCVGLGLVAFTDDAKFAPTDLLRTLLPDVNGSLKGWAVAQGSPGHWEPWGNFPEAVRAGRRQAPEYHGPELWDYYSQFPAEGAAFTTAMDDLSAMVIDEAAKLIDTSGTKTAVDVGGASGSLVHALMLTDDQLHGSVYDLPHVVPDAETAAARKGLDHRFTGVAGDFFESVPAADLHLLKFILHDWPDETCVQILRNCRAGLNEGGRVAVVELLIGEHGEPGLAPLMDMNMLAVVSGKERTLAEYDALFTAAGLTRTKMTRTSSEHVILEATPAD
ncbi:MULTISPECIES: methyltransferase [unclassified Actinopolyspora]|uniref:methyltransferase n=1 Tax=unclassified Actinopolyspora TaxID=2639451 RepID=UPI001A992046|nr:MULTISPECIES: methyltransferase [unclassified Actinopolyspora]